MNATTASRVFPAPEHDHELCLDEALERARKAFEARGLRLTPLREAVFREVLSRGWTLLELTPRQASLEDVFVALTGRHLRDD